MPRTYPGVHLISDLISSLILLSFCFPFSVSNRQLVRGWLPRFQPTWLRANCTPMQWPLMTARPGAQVGTTIAGSLTWHAARCTRHKRGRTEKSATIPSSRRTQPTLSIGAEGACCDCHFVFQAVRSRLGRNPQTRVAASHFDDVVR